MRKFLFLSLCLFIDFFVFGQSQKIKAKIKGFEEGQKITFAYYLGAQQYVKADSAVVQNGEVSFSFDVKDKTGLYLLLLNSSKFYDVIISGTEPDFTIEADTSDFVPSVTFDRSDENTQLYSFKKYLNNLNLKAQEIKNKYGLDTKEQKNMKDEMAKVAVEYELFLDSYIEKNKDKFSGKIIKVNTEVRIPDDLKKPRTAKDSTKLFDYYKTHYFDYIDFSDDRFIRTPFLSDKIDKYFKELVHQIPDSVIVNADKLIDQSKESTEMFRYVLWKVTNKYENSQVIGMDEVFVHLVDKYYLKDPKVTWLDSIQRARFEERTRVLTPLLLNKPAPPLKLYSLDLKPFDLSKVKTKYTVLYFYSHDCGHCKDNALKFNEFAGNNPSITILNISINYEKDKIDEFISKYKMDHVVNLWDAREQHQFKYDFDVYATPTLYLLDQNKKIIAKRLPIEEINRYIEFWEKREKGQ